MLNLIQLKKETFPNAKMNNTPVSMLLVLGVVIKVL